MRSGRLPVGLGLLAAGAVVLVGLPLGGEGGQKAIRVQAARA